MKDSHTKWAILGIAVTMGICLLIIWDSLPFWITVFFIVILFLVA